MTKKGYKQTDKHKKNRGKSISLAKKGKSVKHKSNCICSWCRVKRGESSGAKGKHWKVKNTSKMGSKKGRKHRKDCLCYFCKSKRGEMKGENHPNWQDGKSFEPYGIEFNDQLKEKIRKRDQYRCRMCWKTKKELGYNLDIHHVDYNKNNNIESNLISLCRSCHSKTNWTRENWIKYFQELERKPKVYVAILTTGTVRKELALKLISWLRNTSHDVFVEFTEERPISHCRNNIVKKFLASDNQCLLMIDEDVVPSKNPLEMLKFDKDIVVAPAPIYQYKVLWNVYRTDNEGFWRSIEIDKEKNLIEISAAGTGCILIKRQVLENIKAPFERIFNKDGTEKMGLDLSFCKKAKERGFKIYASIEHKCSHYKTIDLAVREKL